MAGEGVPFNFNVFWGLVRPYWRRIALSGFISILISGLNAGLAWLVQPAMDGVFIHKNQRLLLVLPLALFAIFVLRGLFIFFYEYLMQSAAEKLVTSLRTRLYRHILDLPLGYFSEASSGSLISRVVNDTKAVQGVLSVTVKQFLVESATTLALVAYAFWLKWDLALIALVLMPTAFYLVSKSARGLRSISMRIQQKAAFIVEDLSESFTGIKILKAFRKESAEKERFENRNRDFYRESMRAVRLRESVTIIMEVAAGIGVGFVLWYGGRLVVRGSLTPGQFTSFLSAILLAYTPAKRLSRVNAEIHQMHAPMQRIFEVLGFETERTGGHDIPSIGKSIEFKGVSFVYPGTEKKALAGISFEVNKGQIVALVGESGSGKTTLVNLLPGFYNPTSGHVLIDGTDITSASLASLRDQVAIVSQDVILFNDTVRANLALGKPGAPEEEIIRAATAAYAHDFIMELPGGYETVIGEKGVRLSGGQRQRLSIGRAILKNPPILILDEATSSLDTASEQMVQMALENLMKDRTTFIIAHRLSTVVKAHRIFVMDRGRLAAAGTHEELLKSSPEYRRLYELQFSVSRTG